ncbi:uncharacterized protein LOC110114639 isoform X1 [Dendrobium catenatum]|uniref:Uncharacterized protein n=1 Tax=Dendrobium catenatum TaxID=906689 RepID=A0A2I0VA29_9ASPA|nr:uncharacterized protein LOC110114639 isoform X1 [Dendrobium catenatum]PKU60260.1 hypothetical protein MA16_Dca024490 [Dendrobium catenatum]
MAIHAKKESDVTSLATSSPPQSPRRPTYYVMSPINLDAEKMSGNELSPNESPIHPSHQRYASSPLYYSREFSTARFSASHKTGYWRRVPQDMQFHGGEGFEEEEEEESRRWGIRCYAFLFVIGFLLIFSLFSIILWGASKAHEPKITVKNVVFHSFDIQAGIDLTGVPTEMMSVNSTVNMRFQNPAAFFGVYVSSTSMYLYYFDLMVASGHMEEFYSSQKNQRLVRTAVVGTQVPLYGAGVGLTRHNAGDPEATIPFNLSFVVRSRANVLGKLVRSKFDRRIRCSVYLHESRLGRPVDLGRACQYE